MSMVKRYGTIKKHPRNWYLIVTFSLLKRLVSTFVGSVGKVTHRETLAAQDTENDLAKIYLPQPAAHAVTRSTALLGILMFIVPSDSLAGILISTSFVLLLVGSTLVTPPILLGRKNSTILDKAATVI